ncbi:helix-turn-helix transcriptional regulator, partial [uncultured Adlercreutzia sp.]|uniref:helix-turn-helix domain-containing protein n=1 Tax=uncultured Adlercreutzia sp. TaxID=875803 RepID=UPI0025A5837B
IRAYIEENGLKQSAIAEKIGISKQAMSDSMRGVRRLTADEYMSICRVLGVSPDLFVSTDTPSVPS